MKFLMIICLALSMNSTYALTEDQALADEIQKELELPSDSFDKIHNEIVQEKKVKQRNRTFFCSHHNLAYVIDGMSLRCRNIKGTRYQISFLGFGSSLSANVGLSILFPIKKSSILETGVFTGKQLSFHVGLGMANLLLSDSDKNINYQLIGLTLGAGVNYSVARVVVDEIKPKTTSH